MCNENIKQWKSDDGKVTAKIEYDSEECRETIGYEFVDNYVSTIRTRHFYPEEIPYLYQMAHYFMQANAV